MNRRPCRTRLLRLLLGSWLCVQGLQADPVLDWNDLMIDAIRTDNSGPTLSTRNLAILHTAMFDAVNSVTRTHQPYRFQLAVASNTSAEAAAVAAGYEINKVLYPPLTSRADDLYESYLAATAPSEALTNGLALGREVAALILAERSNDGANTDVPYIPSSEPGAWRRTPPFFRPPLTPHWRYVTPFCLSAVEPFVPPPPPALGSHDYAVALNEVKAIGGKVSAVRTEYQRQTAVFWSDFSYTAMPPGHWHEIAAVIARGKGNTLEENARLFALISVAQADGAIVCWETKFRFNLWRPVTAIQRAGEDNNPETEADPTWDHLLPSPPFPAYTSGHSTFSKASSQILTHFYGTDAITFSTGSDSLPGVFRTYESLAACADEVGMSRIYGGFHYQFDNREGKNTGRKIADFIHANYLLPNARLPLLVTDPFTTNGVPQLRLHGRLGSSVVLESSTNLTTWAAVSTNAAQVGGAVVSLTGLDATCFFRVHEQ